MFNTALRYCARLAVPALALGVAVTAQARITSERMLAQILERTPAAEVVAAGSQMKAAEHAAAAIPGADFFYGVGASMEPLFSSRTALVVAPVEFKDLKPGMTVVYLSREGMMVAHSLTGDVPKGWIAQGVNNDQEDDDLVTPSNLIGVVVQAFAQEPSPWRLAVTQHLSAKGRLVARR